MKQLFNKMNIYVSRGGHPLKIVGGLILIGAPVKVAGASIVLLRRLMRTTSAPIVLLRGILEVNFEGKLCYCGADCIGVLIIYY